MDPYRVFFPLGALTAILGTVGWIAFGFGGQVSYPGIYHPDLMVGGFLFAFSCGFLMTAVPQFTGAQHCRKWELALGFLLYCALLSVGFKQDRSTFHAVSALSLLALVGFCLNRFLNRSYAPPTFFIFVGLGLFMGIAGSVILFISEMGCLSGIWPILGKLIFTQGMMLSLVLGVGTRLLPAIWGWADLPLQITRLDAKESAWKEIGLVGALALVLTVSFLLESSGNQILGQCLRAILVSYLAISHWRILKRPRTRGKLAFWLWVSAWSLCLGLWLPLGTPEYKVHALHLEFIAGFGLMTLMIASRVTLAHGGYGHRLEVRSRALTVSAVLILFSAVTRVIAPFIPKVYFHHLAYAAIAWILAILIWSMVFFPKMTKLKV